MAPAAALQCTSAVLSPSVKHSTATSPLSLLPASSFSGQSLSVSLSSLPSKWTVRSGSSRNGNGTLCRASSDPMKVLIVNTNSGGHAVIGYWLAKQLRRNGHVAAIMTVGEEDSEKMDKPPFTHFPELHNEGVTTIWGDVTDIDKAVGWNKYDIVLDNNGKDLQTVKPVVDWAKKEGAKYFYFISSAGIYKSSDEQPHVEGDPVKSAGHAEVEEYMAKEFPNAWASFRPQYITGALNNKDCEEWFFDRIVRGRPVPIPGSGIQMTVVAPVYDMANMIVTAVENPQLAGGSVFNCVSGRGVTFDGLVRMCAKAAGREAKIVHYDPQAVGVDAKKAFPFRNQHFYSEPRAAIAKLGWKPEYNLQNVLAARFQDYISSGRDKKRIRFDLDDKILEALGVPVTVSV